MTGANFDTTKVFLQDLLKQIDVCRLQLPDFQRDWVWDDDRIRALLASVCASFPIGAFMLLQTGGENVRFKPRPLAGTPEELGLVVPETLILDGQQRLTSLYQSLLGSVSVQTKDTKSKPIRRWYYFDMKSMVEANADREDAILSVPQDRQVVAFGGKITLDASTPEQEYALDLFPANRILDSSEWRQAYSKYWNYEPRKVQLYDLFEREVIKRFEQYQIPVITLGKETSKEAVCLVFERVNTGGVALTVFELLTASFAADNFQLREDWIARQNRLKGKHPLLRGLQSDDFLQAISLLVTQERRRMKLSAGEQPDKAPGISCKRKEILNLQVSDWQTWADSVEDGFVRSARFLHNQKIFRAQDLPYRTQLVPLAAIFVELGHSGETQGVRNKIARWYWCGVLGELYGGATETRFARDMPEVVTWARGETADPITVQEANFQASRLLTLRTRNSAAYKGIYALLMRDGCHDFRTDEPIEAQTFFDDNIDIHHIFPERWCKDAEIEPGFFNSIINKTAISARTNRQIGGRAPSEYLPLIEKSAGLAAESMDQLLKSHCIEAEKMRSNDFWGFFNARAEELLKRIESAIGKDITRESGLFRPGAFAESYEEGNEEWTNEPIEETTS